MPDLSPLAEPDTIPEQPTEETVTMTIPEDVVPANEEVKIDTENNVNTIEQPNPQETVEAKPEEMLTSSPQELLTCKECGLYACNHTPECPILHPVIEKIECDRCHKILNSKEELPAHNLEMHNGRPCEFCKNKDEILKKTYKYLEDCKNAKQPKIPYLEELCVFILDIDEDTISQWSNRKVRGGEELEHPEFHGAIKGIKTLQKLYLLKRTTGRFNPTGAIFQLKTNHGFIETDKKILAGDKSSDPIQITITEEKPTITNE